MELIKNTILGVIRSLSEKSQAAPETNLSQEIKKVLTKKEIKHIRINHFHKGVLTLNVDSAAWLYHFNLHKQDLLEKLRASCAEMKEIRLYLGEVK